MAWLPNVSLADLGGFADAVNKLSESVKSIETSFDSALGFQGAAGAAESKPGAAPPSASPSPSLQAADAPAESRDGPGEARPHGEGAPSSGAPNGTAHDSELGDSHGHAGHGDHCGRGDLDNHGDHGGPGGRAREPAVDLRESDPVHPAEVAVGAAETPEPSQGSEAARAQEPEPADKASLLVSSNEAAVAAAEEEPEGGFTAEGQSARDLEKEQVRDAREPFTTSVSESVDAVHPKVHSELEAKAEVLGQPKGAQEEDNAVQLPSGSTDEESWKEPISSSSEFDAELPASSAPPPPSSKSDFEEAESLLGASVGQLSRPPSSKSEQVEQPYIVKQEEARSSPLEGEPSQVTNVPIRHLNEIDNKSVIHQEENAKLRAELSQMEISLQAAARQAQIKADELARFMAANDELNCRLEELKAKVNESKDEAKKTSEAEVEALREEYQHRLSAAERKVYALTKERDMMRREQSRKSDTSALLKEKDEIIKQVMAEGEELSKKQAAQELQMKKLRSQIRELEDEKQRLSSKLQVEEARAESMKKDKAQTERALQEAVERGQTELAAQKEFYVAALAEAKEAQAQAEAQADSEAKADSDRKLREAAERERSLVGTVEELRQTLSRTEQQAAFREDMLRRDLEDLQKRCQAAESRHEELMARMQDSTRPLLRQIQAVQESANMRVEALAGVERALTGRLQEAEGKAAVAEERERASNERLTQTLSRMSVMEAQLALLRAEQAQLSRSIEKERARAGESRQEYLAAMEAAATHEGRARQLEEEVRELRGRHRREMGEERARREALEQEMEAERAAMAEYEKRVRAEGRAAAEKAVAAAHSNVVANSAAGRMLRRVSSASSGGSAEESAILAASLSLSLNPHSADPPFGGSGRQGGGALPAATMEQVEALLRYKDGELAQYAARVAALEATRDSLAEELVSTTQQCEQLRNEVAWLPGMRAELEALRRRHSSALELMGERDEQVEELRADLADVKQMYREQIDLLVNQIERVSKGAAMAAT